MVTWHLFIYMNMQFLISIVSVVSGDRQMTNRCNVRDQWSRGLNQRHRNYKYEALPFALMVLINILNKHMQIFVANKAMSINIIYYTVYLLGMPWKEFLSKLNDLSYIKNNVVSKRIIIYLMERNDYWNNFIKVFSIIVLKWITMLLK